MQTAEQVKQIADSWKHPAGLVPSFENGKAIRDGINQYFQGVWSHANLDAVAAKLGDSLTYNVKIVERVPSQTQDQVNAVYAEWRRTYAPKGLLENSVNLAILSDYVKSYFANVYTITSLNEAANNAQGLEYETEAQKAQKLENKMRRDYQDSLNSHKPSEDRAPKKKVLDDAEDTKKVNSKIASTINGYTCNNSIGIGIDYTTTEARREEMRKIAASFGKTIKDREAALKAVVKKFMSYPN
jgi:hypothetical protein